jgi:hypothetical protein
MPGEPNEHAGTSVLRLTPICFIHFKTYRHFDIKSCAVVARFIRAPCARSGGEDNIERRDGAIVKYSRRNNGVAT